MEGGKGVERNTRNAGLRSVEPIEDPFPKASFGSIGRFVKVECDTEAQFALPRLTIPYSPDDLGWIDPITLRVFQVDPERGEFRLVRRSVTDPDAMEVHAFIERSGIYGLIGLPRDEVLLRVIRALSALIPPLGEVDGIAVADLMGVVCGRILCLPPEEGGPAGDLVPPGGVEGDACQFCLGRSMPPNGLPEFQLLPVPPHSRQWGRPPPPPPAGPFLYALLSPKWSPNAIVEIVDLNTMTHVRAVQAGPRVSAQIFQSTAIAPTFHGLCVLDWYGGTVMIVDAIVGTRTVPVGPYPRDCVASSDGSKLYVALMGIYGTTPGSIVEVDVVAGKVNRTVHALGLEEFMSLSLSADGLTLAAGTYSPYVYVFDTATLTPKRVAVTGPQSPQTWPSWPSTVRFTDSSLIVVWDPEWDSLYTIDAATATQLPGVMDDLVPDGWVTFANVSYSTAKRAAYATRGRTVFGSPGEGELVVVDIATSSGSERGGFGGFPFSSCLNPRDGKTLYVSVQDMATGQNTLDAFDTQTDTFTRGVYAFKDTDSMVWDLQILG
jgi:DNA-binding beta-propeller fold protein YncE